MGFLPAASRVGSCGVGELTGISWHRPPHAGSRIPRPAPSAGPAGSAPQTGLRGQLHQMGAPPITPPPPVPHHGCSPAGSGQCLPLACPSTATLGPAHSTWAWVSVSPQPCTISTSPPHPPLCSLLPGHQRVPEHHTFGPGHTLSCPATEACPGPGFHEPLILPTGAFFVSIILIFTATEMQTLLPPPLVLLWWGRRGGGASPSGRAMLIFSTAIRFWTSLWILWATPGYCKGRMS